MRESPRIRRLRTDLKVLEQLKSESTILDFSVSGNPPDKYTVKFLGKGFYRAKDNGRILVRDEHAVSVELGASYPRLMPELSWKTPIFHPNISGSGVVCLGGYGTYWVPSLNLDELCEMLWDMVRYQNFDPNSPYNRDAANWSKLQREYPLPIDARPIRDRLTAESAPAAGLEPNEEILFLDDEIVDAEIVDAEIVGPEDPDILIIE